MKKKADSKRAAKSYLDAYQKEEIGELTKEMMYDKSEEMKKAYGGDLKSKKKGKDKTQTITDPETPKENTDNLNVDPNVKPTEGTKQVEEIKPTEVAKPVEDVKPIEEIKPTEVAKPVEDVKPIEEKKP